MKRIEMAFNKNSCAFLFVAFVLFGQAACQSTNGASRGEWTGFLEGPQVDLAAQVGGRLARVLVEEGETVLPGQLVATLEDDLIQQRIAGADAEIAITQAQLALLQAGTRPEEIQRAKAQVAQAQSALVVASQAITDALAIRANPQGLMIQRAAAAAKAQSAAHQQDAAVLQAQAADLQNKFWEELVRMMWGGASVVLPGGQTLHFDTPSSKVVYAQGEWNKAGNAAWQAWAGVTQAQANASGAQSALEDIENQLANPVALDARVNKAKAARESAAANLQAAEASLKVLKDGPSAAQLQAAQSAVAQAKAARAALDQELAYYRITAPDGGMVAQVFYRSGEVVAATAPIVRLSVSGDLTLTVYVPMSTLAKTRVGDTVPVIVEGLQGHSYSGKVTRIADKAEFSGREPQTDSERNAQLIAVEVAVSRSNGVIKPGMPATVNLGE